MNFSQFTVIISLYEYSCANTKHLFLSVRNQSAIPGAIQSRMLLQN